MNIEGTDMTVQLENIEGEVCEIDLSEVVLVSGFPNSKICRMYPFKSDDGPGSVIWVKGTIADIAYEIFQHGFECGAIHEAEKHLYERKAQED